MNKDSINWGTTNILSLFSHVFFPTLLGMIFVATLTIADGIFVGHGVGSDGLAAINIAAPLFLITTGIGLLFGIGASIVATIHLSQNNIKAARINITQAFIAASITMVLLSFVIVFFNIQVAYIFGSSAILLPMVTEYIKWLAPFLVFGMVINLGLFIIRLDGSPVYAMLCNFIPSVLNIILCYVFVIYLHLGVKGSAIATAVSTFIGGIMVIIYMARFSILLHFYRIKLSMNSLRLTIRNIKYMITLGSSAFLGEIAIACMMIVGNYVFINYLGEDGVAAYSIICYCFPFIFMINNAIAQSAQPIISYNYGAKNSLRVQKAFKLSLGMALTGGLLFTAFFIFFSKPLVTLFISTPCNASQIAISGIPYFENIGERVPAVAVKRYRCSGVMGTGKNSL